MGGEGGPPGIDAHDGRNLTVDWTEHMSDDFDSYSVSVRLIQPGMKYYGNFGAFNSSDITPPKQPENIKFNFVSSVIRYKMYILENWNANNFSTIEEMLRSDRIESGYDLFNLIEELYGLESLYFKFRYGDAILLRQYEFLQQRILNFANAHTNATTLDQKRALSYIYTIILSKISALKPINDNRRIITDLSGDFDLLQDEIKRMQSIDNQQAINKYRDDYRDTLFKKINQAQQTLDTLIVPRIDATFNSMYNQVGNLVNEIKGMENKTKEDEKEILRMRSQLQNKLVIHKMLAVIQFVGSTLAVLGPVGMAVGELVGTAASVADSFLDSDNSPTAGEIIQNVRLLANNFEHSVKAIKDKYHRTVNATRNSIDKAAGEVDKLIEEYPHEKELQNTRQHLSCARTQLNNQTNKDPLDPKSKDEVDGIIESLKRYFNDTQNKFSMGKAKKFIERGYQIFNILSTASEFLTATSNDERKIAEMDANIAQLEQQYEALKQFEDGIYNNLVPKIKEIQTSIVSMEERIKSQSHVQLDMSRWQIKETLGRVKAMRPEQLSQYTEFIKQSMDEIGNGMNIMIDVYDRIDSYRDNADMAAYIANVGSSVPRFKDPTLNDKLTDFNALLHSNLVFQRYKLAIEAFGQHYFPFASMILDKFELPNTLCMNDTQSLITNAVDIIHELNQKIIEEKISFGFYNQYIIIDSDASFYTWSYEKANEQISKLLKGESIILNADIQNGILDSAVKFKELQVKFVLQNESLQGRFDEMLQNFDISLEIIDDCFYRCNDKIYYISFAGVLLLEFSFERNPTTGKPQRMNLVYKQILENEPFISPYTTWNIKLKNKDRNNRMDFTKLKTFINEPMNLTLTGIGQFIDRELKMPDICNDQTHVREFK